MLIYYLYTQIQSNLCARFINPEKRLLGNVDSYWTLTWTLLFISEFTKPFKWKVVKQNHPQPSLGDNYSITTEGRVGYAFIELQVIITGYFGQIIGVNIRWMLCLAFDCTYFRQKPCSCTCIEYKNQGHSTVLCKFGGYQLSALDEIILRIVRGF